MTRPAAAARASRTRLPMIVIGGLVASAMLVVSLTSTFSAFTASLDNIGNRVTSGTLVLQELAGGNPVCTSSSPDATANRATCSQDVTVGSNLVPGDQVTQTNVLKNAGSVNARSFVLTGGTCQTSASSGAAASGGGDLCSAVQLAVQDHATGTTLATTTFGALAQNPVTLGALGSGQTRQLDFVITFASGSGNAFQGMTASVPVTWTATAGS